ncbi:MAG: leucine-rich repeat protein, partial [Clostridia bacterium]|nr:leucine-rich repeat protein [Clostridia bacterium]
GLLMDRENHRVIASLAQISYAKVIVPEGITEISDSAFAGNDKIETLILPNSVTHLGAWALRDMKNLKYLEIKAKNVTFGDSPLFGTCPEEFICTDDIAKAIEEMEA